MNEWIKVETFSSLFSTQQQQEKKLATCETQSTIFLALFHLMSRTFSRSEEKKLYKVEKK